MEFQKRKLTAEILMLPPFKRLETSSQRNVVKENRATYMGKVVVMKRMKLSQRR